MTAEISFDYYYGDESNQFSFYRIPRQLITGDSFKRLSTDAKLLYGLLLDRMGLSAKNGWYDEAGRVYIYYTLDEIQGDSVVGDGIKGAKFKIYVSKDKTENGTYQELDSTFYYTDENGIIHLDNLDTGWYKIVEVEPAAGFSMKEPHEQIIYVQHDTAVEVTFENTPLNAIIVQKYDSVTHEALPGCTFQLRYLAGTSGTGGTVIGTQVTSKNGIAMWTGLKPGAYVIEEIDPADGYSIINSSETVYLADNGEQSVITVIFTNSPDGSLLIRKVCAVNPSTTLQDAEFKVTYSDGTLIGDSNGIYRTDANGEILIDGLKPGKSVVVTETKAPAGFLIPGFCVMSFIDKKDATLYLL